MTGKDNKIDKKIYAQLIFVIIGGVLCFAILIHTFLLVSQKSKETAEFGSESGTGISTESGAETVRDAFMEEPAYTEPPTVPTYPPVNNRDEIETEKEIYISPEIAKLYKVPGEILDSSTQELLEYFMSSSFMNKYYDLAFELTFTSAWSPVTVDQMAMMDISRHEAFRELVARGDLLPELEEYAKSLWASSSLRPGNIFNIFLDQQEVRARVEANTGNYPRLRAIYKAMENVPKNPILPRDVS